MAFTKLVNFVKDFFSKMFDTKKKLMARITSLEVKVKGIKGTPSKDKVKGAGIGKVFGSEAASTIPEILKGDSVKENLAKVSSHIGVVGDLAKGVESQASFDAITANPYSGLQDATGSAPEGMKWVVLLNVGTTDIIALDTKEKQTGKAAYKMYAAFQIKSAKSTKVSESDTELAALTTSDMNGYLLGSRKIVANLMNESGSIKTLKSGLDLAIVAINRVIAMGDKNDDNIGDRGTVARSAVTAVANSTIKGVVSIESEALRGVQAVLTYVERSISNFSEEAKKDEKK